MAWLRTSYEAHADGGRRLMRFAGHWLSPRKKTTAWLYTDRKSPNPTVAAFTLRRASTVLRGGVYRLYDPDGRLRYSIARSFWGGRCRLFFFGCKPEWFIYRGWLGGSVAYYAIGEDEVEADAPNFLFYRSKEESWDAWSARVDHQRRLHDDEDVFEVKVKLGEDTGLILAAATIIDRWADMRRR
eukprot:CAMPEP_0180605828 /NCGR_PEP_ID=MMETSP1037_2-20121125/26827_1 /TAXON_ID=632150 /ORGANISM="Azadinium spinosum, Strain 3D9" /LENGTH=184 /DNA_ID=CAMNT_0022624971 /DNA_START=12 /DNA_END=566 /DNA_ORIENTATION=-